MWLKDKQVTKDNYFAKRVRRKSAGSIRLQETFEAMKAKSLQGSKDHLSVPASGAEHKSKEDDWSIRGAHTQ